MTTIACCQFAPTLGDVRANVDRSRALIVDAAAAGADIVVLPELASSGYAFVDSDEARAAATSRDGAAVTAWRDAADRHGLVVVAGFCETNPDGAPFNSAVLVRPDHEPVVYRKAHLWNRERLLFSAGDEAPPTVTTPHGRIAPLICYDLEFPEWVRIPALDGADLICAPVNWPRMPRPVRERPAEVVRVQAQASMNHVAIAACDRSGRERGIDWTAASAIVDADGWPVATAEPDSTGDVVLTAELDLPASRRKRVAEFSDLLADRRPELYGQVSEPHGSGTD